MDFSRILDAWERQGNPNEPPSKDNLSSPALPSRAAMEQTPADDELDLHGLVQEEALTVLRAFLSNGLRAGHRKVLIIHGKGLHSENHRAVLREAVQQVLSKDRHVVRWGQAGRKEGGQGASWAWLGVFNVRGK